METCKTCQYWRQACDRAGMCDNAKCSVFHRPVADDFGCTCHEEKEEPTEYRPGDGPARAVEVFDTWAVYIGAQLFVSLNETEEEAVREVNRINTACREWAAKQQPGWISVKERLPEDGKFVFVWLCSGWLLGGEHGYDCSAYGYYSRKENRWVIWNPGRTGDKVKVDTVTHWRPFPEPPKGDQ